MENRPLMSTEERHRIMTREFELLSQRKVVGHHLSPVEEKALVMLEFMLPTAEITLLDSGKNITPISPSRRLM